jgi:hypothetical protein
MVPPGLAALVIVGRDYGREYRGRVGSMAEPSFAAPPEVATERDALLATKLHTPRPRPDLIPRPRLVQHAADLVQGAAWARGGRPLTVTEPLVGPSGPRIIRIVVELPAPLRILWCLTSGNRQPCRLAP